MDIPGFLSKHPPFDALPVERVRKLARSVEVAHFPAGQVILRQDGPPTDSLYVVRKGAVALSDDQLVLDLLGEGEVFGQFSLLARESPTVTVAALEDSLCYLLPASAAHEVLGTPSGISFVIGSMRQRVRAAAGAARAGGLDPRLAPVGSLLRRRPVTASAETSAADAAALMTRERVSSLLIPRSEGFGIVTDRDLRSRLVAARGSLDAPIGSIATFPVSSVDESTTAGDVLVEMFAAGVHHFPVTRDGSIVGVVTDTDLMGFGRHTPFALRSAIERASTIDDVVAAARGLPDVAVTMIDALADPFDVGRVIALTIEVATERLLAIAIATIGDAPAAWAWIALGSTARREQALHTDQDHMLAFEVPEDVDAAECDAYFARLAELVTDGLERAGVPRCPGDAMAVHPMMRRSLDAWVTSFREWMDDPNFEHGVLSSIAFDPRKVAGPLDAEPALDRVIREGGERPSFVRMLGRKAVTLHPPTGFFRDLVVEDRGEHAGLLDIKHGGITIATNLARCLGIRAGSSAKGTPARLRAAVDAGLIDDAIATELEQAFRFLWEVRLRHQAGQVKAGTGPDDFIDPAKLGTFYRSGLKEAFRALVRCQKLLATDLGIDAR